MILNLVKASAENTSLLITRLLQYESRIWNLLGNSVCLVETMD